MRKYHFRKLGNAVWEGLWGGLQARKAHLILAVSAFLFCWLLFPTDPDVRKGLAITVLAAILWFTQVIPVMLTGLLLPLLAAVMGILSADQAFTDFGDPMIFLFMGGFVLAASIRKYHLDNWLARNILKLSGGRFLRTSFLLMACTAALSMWINNTSSTAMMVPLALGILSAIPDHRRREEQFLLLGIAYAASLGGMGTVIGSAPNGIASSLVDFRFSQWMLVGVPMVLLMVPLAMLLLWWYFKPRAGLKLNVLDTPAKLSWDTPTRLTLAIFCVTVTAWAFETPLAWLTGLSTLRNLIAVAAILAIGTLSLLSWQEMQRGIDWGVLILFGGGLTLGRIVQVTGFSDWLAYQFMSHTSGIASFPLLLAVCLTAMLLSQVMSNTATTVLLVPMLIPLAQGMGLAPWVLAVPAALASACAVMLPIGSPPNAIVFATELIRARDMVRNGLLLGFVGAFAIAVWFYLLLILTH